MSKIVLVKPPLSMEELYGELSEAGSLEPPLGLAYLAASLRARGIEVEIVDCLANHLSLEEATREILKREPEYVGITAVTIDIYSAAELAKRIKGLVPHITTIIGGVHVTAMPYETMQRFEQFDIAVVNEGEMTVCELINALGKKEDLGAVKGIVFREGKEVRFSSSRTFIENLDTLPIPAWDLLPYLPKYYRSPAYSMDRSPSSSLITSRGCGMGCTFCFQGAFGKGIRMHSSEYVIRMIKHLYHKYGIRNIRIVDDNFLLNRKRVMEICEALIREKLDLTFSCLSRVDTINPEMLKILKKAGCWQLIYGIESGSQKILDGVNKKVTLGKIEQALKMTKLAGIRSLGYFMIGFPSETEETIQETINFALRLPLDDFKMNILAPFPGSELYKTAHQFGTFNSDWRKMNMYVEPCFIPAGLTKGKILGLRKKAFKKFYLRPRIIFGYLARIRNPSHIFKLYLGVKSLLKFWLKNSSRNGTLRK